jgi:hypothetical protein
MGLQTYWIGLNAPATRYLSFEQLAHYQHYDPAISLAGAMQNLHPDYLILDNYLDRWLVDPPAGTVSDRALEDVPNQTAASFFDLSRPALNSFLAAHATQIGQVRTVTYGDVRIYAIHWP